jgi:DNA invertase Pin-like site-specific DNA recombinase
MLIGYARVSTDDQTLDLQVDALEAAGCARRRIYTDTASGAKTDRPGLGKALEVVREGDTLVVWRLDRLGRTLPHLLQLVEDLNGRQIGFRSLTESIDTTSPTGEWVFHIFGALAQFERNLIRERTLAGLKAARARGRKGGGRYKLDEKQIAHAKALYADKSNTIDDICKTLRVSRATLWRYVKRR